MTLQDQYLPILLFFLTIILLIILPVIFNYLLTKLINYRCPPYQSLNQSKKYYQFNDKFANNAKYNLRSMISKRLIIIVILGITFELAMICLIPCGLVWFKLPLEAKLSIGFFNLIVIVGYIYAWMQGAINSYDAKRARSTRS